MTSAPAAAPPSNLDGGDGVDGFQTLLEMIQCYRVAQPLHVAAELGIAELVADHPLGVEELAERTSTHADSLYRTLRVLARAGVFTESAGRRFGLTPLGTGLRDGGPLRALAVLLGGLHYRVWGELLTTVRTGAPAFPRLFGRSFHEYVAADPSLQRIVTESMTGLMEETTTALMDAYDFSGVRTLIDVGGGQGRLVRAAVERHPDLRGVVLELPPVAAAATAAFRAAGVGERAEAIGGDMFERLPAGGDVYVLSRMLQGLDDRRALAVLGRCADVLPVGGRVLVAEMVITDDHSVLTAGEDVHMMLVTAGGRIRTDAEHRDLMHAAGLRPTRVVPTAAPLPFTVVEGVRP